MVIVDEKWNPLEILNIPDMVVTLMILLLLCGTVLSCNQQEVQPVPVKVIEVTVRVPRVVPETALLLNKNDKLVTGSHRALIKAVQIKPIPQKESGPQKITLDDIYVTIIGTSTVSEAGFKMGNQTIRLGYTYQIVTSCCCLTGTVESINVS